MILNIVDEGVFDTDCAADKNDSFWSLMRNLIGQREAEISRKYIERFLDFEKNCCQDVKGHDNVSWHLIINI